MSTMAERFKEVLTDLKKRRRIKAFHEIAELAGLSPSTITEINGGRMNPSDAILKVLQKKYSVNTEYITENKGSMYVNGEGKLEDTRPNFPRNARAIGEPVDLHTTKSGNVLTETSEGDYIMYPHVVAKKAQAGYMTGWGDQEYVDSLPVRQAVVKEIHKGTYMWFEIVGDSMDDGTIRSIPDKSMVLGRSIQRSFWKSKFHYKEHPYYIIVHRDEGIICKQIIDHDVNNGIIVCHSLNPNKAMYNDFSLRLDDCMQIFNVVQKQLATNV